MTELERAIYEGFVEGWGEEFEEEAESYAMRTDSAITVPISVSVYSPSLDVESEWAKGYNEVYGEYGEMHADDFDDHVDAWTEHNGVLYFYN